MKNSIGSLQVGWNVRKKLLLKLNAHVRASVAQGVEHLTSNQRNASSIWNCLKI